MNGTDQFWGERVPEIFHWRTALKTIEMVEKTQWIGTIDEMRNKYMIILILEKGQLKSKE